MFYFLPFSVDLQTIHNCVNPPHWRIRFISLEIVHAGNSFFQKSTFIVIVINSFSSLPGKVPINGRVPKNLCNKKSTLHSSISFVTFRFISLGLFIKQCSVHMGLLSMKCYKWNFRLMKFEQIISQEMVHIAKDLFTSTEKIIPLLHLAEWYLMILF